MEKYKELAKEINLYSNNEVILVQLYILSLVTHRTKKVRGIRCVITEKNLPSDL